MSQQAPDTPNAAMQTLNSEKSQICELHPQLNTTGHDIRLAKKLRQPPKFRGASYALNLKSQLSMLQKTGPAPHHGVESYIARLVENAHDMGAPVHLATEDSEPGYQDSNCKRPTHTHGHHTEPDFPEP